MSSSRKQQIRPRFVDLAEFDDEQFKPSQPGQESDGSNAFNWPAAATVVRRPPPCIGSAKPKPPQSASIPEASSQSAKKKSVRIATESQNEDRNIESTGKPSSKFAQRRATDQTKSNTGFSFGPSSQPTASHVDEQEMPSQFELDFDQDGNVESYDGISAGPPLIGGISERPRGARPAAKTKPKSGSRFLASREMEKAIAASRAPAEQEPGTGFPVVSRRDVVNPILPPTSASAKSRELVDDITSAPALQMDLEAQKAALGGGSRQTGKAAAEDQEEEWLDDDGHPMSAFRKSRLLMQGLRPSSVRAQDGPSTVLQNDVAEYVRDPTQDPGGGADPESITAMLASVSAENDEKIRAMGDKEVQDALQSLESLFGKGVLDALRYRKPQVAGESSADTTKGAAPLPAKAASSNIPATSAKQEDKDGPSFIRQRYFPGEPEGPNASLEWMMPASSTAPAAKSSESKAKPPRFDFEGRMFGDETDADKTYLSGLHNHGDDQESPGYTTSELLHLAKSTVAAQRQLAVNVLGRICSTYPSGLASPVAAPSEATALLDADSGSVRARTLLSSRWLLEDRNFSVRSAALHCLASVIRSSPAGNSPVCGASLFMDWTRTASSEGKSKKDRANMAFEELVKTDWTGFLIDSGFLHLCLGKTSLLVNSSWDAEALLEILWRIASCSPNRAKAVLGDQDKRGRDHIVNLGLKTMWPLAGAAPQSEVDQTGTPAQKADSFSWPSLFAAKLLLLGVMSGQELAKVMVLEGTIDQLMRFVMLQPWTLEQDLLTSGCTKEDGDLVIRAYEIFGTCLELYQSLGRYGFYASVAGRTWSLWQTAGKWALELVQQPASASSALMEAKINVAERLFALLEVWTVCAKDPHQLLSHHDITWTQVRDWIDISLDILSSKNQGGRIAGAVWGHVHAWIECAKGKELAVLFCTQSKIEEGFRHSVGLVTEALCRDMAAACSALKMEQLATACHSATNLLRLGSALDEVQQLAEAQAQAPASTAWSPACQIIEQAARKLLASTSIWNYLSSSEALATGAYSYKRFLVHFIRVAVNQNEVTEKLSLLPILSAAYRPLVGQTITEASLMLGDGEIEKVLRPFLDECVYAGRPGKGLSISAAAEVDIASERLTQAETLFFSEVGEHPSAIQPEAKEQEKQEDDKEVDPMTEEPLWRCPANTLPIRADWPLLALDDLLHSGNTAVFNRPDNLPADWKANEKDIVQSSLQLAVSVFSSLLRSGASPTAQPSSEQIWLAVTKVFMLEKDQPDMFVSNDTANPTGALTGRDLFRDASISPLLTSLLDIADELRTQTAIELEEWTHKTLGSTVSFYQYFTDLLGLYDSISFGDANFARLLMVLTSGLPIDFRRLLWNDYRDALRTIRIKVGEGKTMWWGKDVEGNVDMLGRYAQVLLQRQKERDSVVYQVALHQLAKRWWEGEKDERIDKMVKNVLQNGSPTLVSDFVGLGDGLDQIKERLVVSVTI